MSSVSLNVKNISHSFAGIRASDDISFEVSKGSITGVIGPNGAGKSTLFNIITGRYTPDKGTVFFESENITGQKSNVLACSGLVRTFQNNRLFKSMTVVDHLKCAMKSRCSYGLFDAIFRTKKFKTEEKNIDQIARSLLQEFGLGELADIKADGLAYGQQKLLEIVRALSLEPKMLLLDEPAAGLNETESLKLARLIRSLRDKYNVTVLLIEHDMKLVMGVCEKIIVLVNGKKITEGEPSMIKTHPKVIEAYLGREPVK